MSGWGWVAMAVGTLLFVAVLILGGIAVYRGLNRSTSEGSPVGLRAAPQQVLADRFARGDIDEEEYRRRLEALRSSGTAHRP